MVAPRLELQRVPRVRCHLDLMILKRPPAAVDHVVDRAVVFERVASRDVVVVGVAIAPHQTESLVDAAGQRPRADGESHVAQRLVLHDGQRESIVRLVRTRLQENMILPAPLRLNRPPALRAAAGAAKLEAGRQCADTIVFERERLWRERFRGSSADCGERQENGGGEGATHGTASFDQTETAVPASRTGAVVRVQVYQAYFVR